MPYLYLKAIHIIFVVTWFAGLFYMPRLFIYNTEASIENETEKNILRKYFTTMLKRLWYGITWPSAIITLIFGIWVLINTGYYLIIFKEGGRWLLIKLIFVIFLYAYHWFLQIIVNQEVKGIFKYTSQYLRILNEVATVFLVSIVMLVTVKDSLSFVWGLVVLIALIIVLMVAIKIYKNIREKK
jgi:protoporphyrinogen IX oxidase